MSSELVEFMTNVLLATIADVHLAGLTTDEPNKVLTVALISTQPHPCCPCCQTPAQRVHSTYTRHLADLPWAQWAVQLQLRVRKCFCPNPDCRRKIFSERVLPLAAPWARRTVRLANVQQQVGLALGGAAGTRLATTLTMPTGIDSLLHLIRQTPLPIRPTPRALGIDDWAQRKGHTYGTILVDLSTGQPFDLLPDRSAESVAAWLQAHPGVEIIGRDRATLYAEGARLGAPAAIQVADRWHLLKNLGETVLEVLQPHQRTIEQAFMHLLAAPASPLLTTVASTPAEAARSPASLTDDSALPVAPVAAHTQARYEQIQALWHQGWSQSAIAAHLRLDRKTVRKYLCAATCPSRQRRQPQRSLLDAYKPYLHRRWQAGCHNVAQLLREIQQQGFLGQRSIVRTFIAQLRQAQGSGSLPDTATTRTLPNRLPTLRSLVWLILCRPDQRDAATEQQLTCLRQAHPHLETLVTLAQTFASCLRKRQGEQLDSWLEQARTSDLAPLRRFAHRLRQDYAAVKAAASLPWSNGPTEGNVNRLKLLKRQMFGRAKIDLLRQRLLAA